MDVDPYVAFATEVQQIGGVPTTVITCLTNELTQEQLAPGMDLIICGDEITISGPLSLPGQNMTIIARTVTIGAGASIDLSGAAGAPLSPAQAGNGLPGASAQQPDATDGTAGQTGNHGQASGSLVLAAGTVSGTVAVTCQGGAGGPGQQGGDGGTGLDGANGANYVDEQTGGPPNFITVLVSQGQPGTNGGRAGFGGAGGQGGDGAPGGTITIASFSAEPAVTPQNGGGAGGAGGAAARRARRGRAAVAVRSAATMSSAEREDMKMPGFRANRQPMPRTATPAWRLRRRAAPDSPAIRARPARRRPSIRRRISTIGTRPGYGT